MTLSEDVITNSRCYVGGQFIQSSDFASMPVYDPSSGARVSCVPALSDNDIRSALTEADKSGRIWRAHTGTERGIILNKWADLLEAQTNEVARLITLEVGKPLQESRGEVAYSVGLLRWYGAEASRAYGEVIPSSIPGRRILSTIQPIGVVAAITPWNFPASMVARKVAPALAAGCTVVMKPAPEAPLTALALAQLAHAAGFPPGVYNVVTGDERMIGECFTASKVVRMITFTGSTAIGSWLMERSAPTVKRLSLELGGNAPFIVLGDADCSVAIEQLVTSKFRACGQTCVCPNNILVHSSIFDEFVSKTVARIKQLTVGGRDDTSADVGPLIRGADADRMVGVVSSLVGRGFSCQLGGHRLRELGENFFAPTLLTGDINQGLVEEEIFGPVAVLIRYTDETEMVNRVNSLRSGLAGYIMGRDISRLLNVSDQLDLGVVGINTAATAAPELPFGGLKESGMGKEGGRDGLYEFCDRKAVCIAL